MKIDMSRQAVTMRLEQVAKLRRVCLSLAKSKKSAESTKGRLGNDKVQQPRQAKTST